MTDEELIKRLALIAEDARSGAGCSHEDALQGSLKDLSTDIQDLIKDVSTSKYQ